jgi:hypothetical protein
VVVVESKVILAPSGGRHEHLFGLGWIWRRSVDINLVVFIILY